MRMLLEGVSIDDLRRLLEAGEGCSHLQYLLGENAAREGRRLAKKNGIWDELSRNFNPAREISAIKRSAYRRFRRSGERTSDALLINRRTELDRAATAVWLGHPKGDLDYLQDILWVLCDDWTWVGAAHEGLSVDLFSAETGLKIAETLYLLGGMFEEEVRERVKTELMERIFRRFTDYRNIDEWKTIRTNWNTVCNGAIIRTALCLADNDTGLLAHLIHAPIQNMTYALEGFSPDGGCREGPSYWAYGFGAYVYAAHALYLRTGGRLNLMSPDPVEKISKYPLAASIKPPLSAAFGDASHGYLPAGIAIMINRFYRIPGLLSLCRPGDKGSPALSNIHEIGLYGGEKAREKGWDEDAFLPELGLVKMRGSGKEDGAVLAAIAGDNGRPHNHNDIGSFFFYKNDRIYLEDPGAPLYTRNTFSAGRYENIFCNSRGHSVPVINNCLQDQGASRAGTITVEHPAGENKKRAVIAMEGAYPEGLVKTLRRTFILDPSNDRLVLEDYFEFPKKPDMLEESFVTFEKASVLPGGRSVAIGPKTKRLVIKTEKTPGRFRVRELKKEAAHGKTRRTFARVSFTPSGLSAKMNLRFVML